MDVDFVLISSERSYGDQAQKSHVVQIKKKVIQDIYIREILKNSTALAVRLDIRTFTFLSTMHS